MKFHFKTTDCDFEPIMENDNFKNVSFYQKYQNEEEIKEEGPESESSEDSEEEERKTLKF